MSFRNNVEAVKQQMRERLPDALEGMGQEAVRMVVAQMESGYGMPIRKTGALMADVDSQVSGDRVEVGNRLHYSLYVHEGTCKMAGRHYITDALYNAQACSALGQIAKEKLFGE